MDANILEIGREYKEVEIDFLTKLPWKETFVTYMGKHPYDGRHVFASKTGGTIMAPDDGKMFDKLERA